MLEHELRWAWPGVLSRVLADLPGPSPQAEDQAEVPIPDKQTAVRQSALLQWTSSPHIQTGKREKQFLKAEAAARRESTLAAGSLLSSGNIPESLS